jgi:hypothetical protein
MQLDQDQQEAIREFPVLAGNFCQLIDGSEKLDQSQFVHGLATELAGLCAVGTRLPATQPTNGPEPKFTQESLDEHAKRSVALAIRLGKQLGSLNQYWDVFDPTEKESPILCALSQDIADIYMDMQEALVLQAQDIPAPDLYWQWRFDFQSHWSRHAASALRVLLILSTRV